MATSVAAAAAVASPPAPAQRHSDRRLCQTLNAAARTETGRSGRLGADHSASQLTVSIGDASADDWATHPFLLGGDVTKPPPPPPPPMDDPHCYYCRSTAAAAAMNGPAMVDDAAVAAAAASSTAVYHVYSEYNTMNSPPPSVAGPPLMFVSSSSSNTATNHHNSHHPSQLGLFPSEAESRSSSSSTLAKVANDSPAVAVAVTSVSCCSSRRACARTRFSLPCPALPAHLLHWCIHCSSSPPYIPSSSVCLSACLQPPIAVCGR